MLKRLLLIMVAIAFIVPSHVSAQLMNVFLQDSVPVSFEIGRIDSVCFSNEPAFEEITEFRFKGSYSVPTSAAWGNTGFIPLEYGQNVTYTSEGLNDYCCVFFNSRHEAISFGEYAPGLSDQNQKATVITESLVAPRGTSYVCIYGKLDTGHPSFVPYTLSVKINRLYREERKPVQNDYLADIPTARVIQMLTAGYSNTEMTNSGLMSDVSQIHSSEVTQIAGLSAFDGQPCITIIDDDALDFQIPSSYGATRVTSNGYGYYSLLLPFTLSLADRYGVDVKAGLAVEGHRVGLTTYMTGNDDYSELNENGRLVKQLNEKVGWEVLNHSMTAQLPVNSYGVESIDSELAGKILAEGKYDAVYSFNNTMVLDKSTGKWYEVNKDKTGWVERVPTNKYAQLYYRDYGTSNYHINRSFDFDYSWGEWFRRADELGLPYIKAIVYNGGSTSPFTIASSRKYADFGIRTHVDSPNVPPLSASVNRFTVTASSADNVQVDAYRKKMLDAVDKCIDQGAWLVFMSHIYNPSMYNGYNANCTYTGKDDDYPTEWVIPLKRDEILTMDLNNYWEKPPARLNIKRWSEWHPAPGTQLAAFYEVIEYAITKGVRIVLPSKGWETHGNRVQLGVDMNGTQQIYNIVDSYTDEEQSFFTVGADGTIRYYFK